MKSFLAWAVVLVVFGGLGAFGFKHQQMTERSFDYERRLNQLKREFLVQSKGLQLLDTDTYRKEVGIQLTKYFAELAKLAKEHPELYDAQREKARGMMEVERGRMSEDQKAARDERIDFALDVFERMRTGQYRPIYTAADKTFRFDIYDISPAKLSGEERVKISYVHWGAFGPMTYKSIIGNIQAAQKEGKPVEIPQIVGDGPPSLQVEAERWVNEFIPGVEVGYYDLPLFPSEAQTLELSFMFGVRTIGGTDVPVSVSFPGIPIAESWKLKAGEAWQAQERFADEDELRAAGAKKEDEKKARR